MESGLIGLDGVLLGTSVTDSLASRCTDNTARHFAINVFRPVCLALYSVGQKIGPYWFYALVDLLT